MISVHECSVCMDHASTVLALQGSSTSLMPTALVSVLPAVTDVHSAKATLIHLLLSPLCLYESFMVAPGPSLGVVNRPHTETMLMNLETQAKLTKTRKLKLAKQLPLR